MRNALLAAGLALVLSPFAFAGETWLRIDRPDASLRADLPDTAIEYPGFVWLPDTDLAVRHGRAGERLHAVVEPFGMRVAQIIGGMFGGAFFDLQGCHGQCNPSKGLEPVNARAAKTCRDLAPGIQARLQKTQAGAARCRWFYDGRWPIKSARTGAPCA